MFPDPFPGWRALLAAVFASTLALIHALAALADRQLTATSLAIGVGAGLIARGQAKHRPGAVAVLLATLLHLLGALLECTALLAAHLRLGPIEVLRALDPAFVFALWWERRATWQRALVPLSALLALLVARLPLSGRRRSAP